MLKNKSFVRKSRLGKVLKVLKEHYLRDDIGCGFNSCIVCDQLSTILLDTELLSSDHVTFGKHVIIPDTNILFHQIDLIENSAFSDVIILQTVLDELRHRSLSIYSRVRRLTAGNST